jgi:hypothetical protein
MPKAPGNILILSKYNQLGKKEISLRLNWMENNQQTLNPM